MKTEASLHSHFDHDRVWDLLPYYSEAGLESRDHAAVTRHLGECLLCRRELERLDVLRRAVAVEPHEHACANAFARLNRHISEQAETPSLVARVAGLLRGVFEPVPLAAGASLLVVSAVLTASIVYFGQERPESVLNQPFQTLGTQSASRFELGRPIFRIVLADELSQADVKRWLDQHGAELIHGPTEIGVMTVRVALGNAPMAAVLDRIRADEDTLFVEPVDRVGVRPDRLR